jgi:Lar family restriction alleviation protein
MTAPELLPCPFCGGSAKVTGSRYGSARAYQVMCLDCNASSGFLAFEEDAIAAWNRRADIAAAAIAERDALRAVLEGMEFRNLDVIATQGADAGLALGTMAKQAIVAERDALRAEVERLRGVAKPSLDEIKAVMDVRLQSMAEARSMRELVLSKALRDLLSACEAEFGRVKDLTEYDFDEEPVGMGQTIDGTPDPMAITFGHLRRADAALAALEGKP